VKVAYEFYLKHPDETLIVVTADHDTGGVAIGWGNEWMGDTLNWDILDSVWNAAGGRNTLEWEENRKLNESAYIGWPTSHHTGDNVPVYAIGKGAERFCGKMDNTDFKGKILAE
jgi:alkaline phosphatase